MQIFIKNMVCDRCKSAVDLTLRHLGHTPVSIELGEVEIAAGLSDVQKTEVDNALKTLGFELIDDPKLRLSEKVKSVIIDLVHAKNNDFPGKLSDYLSDKLNHEYTFLSNAFSRQSGTTIEQFYIAQKIERVKELLEYAELNLNQISDSLHYASASHLTRQFKKITGQTPTEFKNANQKRQTLDSI